MLKFRGVAQFVDGSELAFETGNAALAAWERYAMRHKLPMGKESPPILSSMVMAHHALGVEQGFDAWSETVEGIELEAIGGEEGNVPPTPQEASTV